MSAPSGSPMGDAAAMIVVEWAASLNRFVNRLEQFDRGGRGRHEELQREIERFVQEGLDLTQALERIAHAVPSVGTKAELAESMRQIATEGALRGLGIDRD